MKKIFIIAAFTSVGGNDNSRPLNVAYALKNKRCDCTLITTDFSHGDKKYRDYMPAIADGIKYEYIHVPSYPKNLSIRRFWSHVKFARGVKQYLKKLSEKPDVLYCAMPTSTSAYQCGKYCKKNNVRFIIDVIDLWPNSLLPIMPMKKLVNLILSPWYHYTHSAYRSADYISAESKEYANVAHEKNPNVPYSHTYLGIDVDNIKSQIAESQVSFEKDDNYIYLCYGGSLGNSYDFDSILKAVKFIHNKRVKYQMLFVGDGDNRAMIESYAKENNLNITVTGRLSYKDLLKYLSLCDIAFNAFTPGTLVVHSYKFNDYVACGNFILNNLKGETADMIEQYQIGRNFDQNNVCEVLYDVCQNWFNIKQKYKSGLNKLINTELDKNMIYSILANRILSDNAEIKFNETSIK